MTTPSAVPAPQPTSPARAPGAAHDVVVVGGGAAGLAAAVVLARSLRTVAVVDAGAPRNAPAAGVHNLLGREGTPPRDLVAAGRREAAGYGAVVVDDRAVAARRTADGFAVDLACGGTLHARRLLLATGLVDELPDVPGLHERWGRDVLHCPFCHGWEVRGTRVGVLATSPAAAHQALLMRALTPDVTLLRHAGDPLAAEDEERLAALDVRTVDGPVVGLHVVDDALRGVRTAAGRTVALDALVVAPRFVARGALYEQLGGTLVTTPSGTHVPTGAGGRTDLPGVWAAGNVGDLSATVAVASAAGMQAGAALHGDLVAHEADAAVAARRATDRSAGRAAVSPTV